MICTESENVWTWTKPSAWHICPCVSSWFDYCNSLLHGVTVRNMLKLQRVQNCDCLARVVTRVSRFAPSPPPPFVTLSTGYPFPSAFSSNSRLKPTRPSLLVNHPLLLILSIWPHPRGIYDSTLLSAPKCKTKTRTRVSAFAHLLSGASFPCVFTLLNPWLVFGNV